MNRDTNRPEVGVIQGDWQGYDSSKTERKERGKFTARPRKLIPNITVEKFRYPNW